MKIIQCEQGSAAWWEYHRGRPTASNFSRILTAKTRKLSSGIDELICELLSQLGNPGSIAPEGYISRPMANGIALEPEARNLYSLLRDVDVEQCGICLTDDGRFGASPDALVPRTITESNDVRGKLIWEGGVELKCPTPKVHVSYLWDGKLPHDYFQQVHGELWVTGLDWIDFVSHCHGWELFVVRVIPDDYTRDLGAALEKFWLRYMDAVAVVFPGKEMKLLGCDTPLAPLVADESAITHDFRPPMPRESETTEQLISRLEAEIDGELK